MRGEVGVGWQYLVRAVVPVTRTFCGLPAPCVGQLRVNSYSRGVGAGQDRNGRKFVTRGTTVHILGVLLTSDCLSLVWGHSVHIAKFPNYDLQFYSFPNFHAISAKLICHEGI